VLGSKPRRNEWNFGGTALEGLPHNASFPTGADETTFHERTYVSDSNGGRLRLFRRLEHQAVSPVVGDSPIDDRPAVDALPGVEHQEKIRESFQRHQSLAFGTFHDSPPSFVETTIARVKQVAVQHSTYCNIIDLEQWKLRIRTFLYNSLYLSFNSGRGVRLARSGKAGRERRGLREVRSDVSRQSNIHFCKTSITSCPCTTDAVSANSYAGPSETATYHHKNDTGDAAEEPAQESNGEP